MVDVVVVVVLGVVVVSVGGFRASRSASGLDPGVAGLVRVFRKIRLCSGSGVQDPGPGVPVGGVPGDWRTRTAM